MAIDTYATLKTAVLDWINRPELTTQVVDFIRLAELEFAPLLRANVARAALTLDAEVVALPAEVGELRSVRLNTGSYFHALQMVTPETLADYRRGSTGVPVWATIVDGELILAPAPDSAYEAEIIYFEALVPLSDAATTNSTLLEAHNVYLFGALAQAELYLEHDERVGMWTGKMEKAVTDVNNARERAELAASPHVMRLPRVFG